MESLILLLLEFPERLRPVFWGGWMRPLWLCWKCLNYLGSSDLKIKMSASHKVPWCSPLRTHLCCSLRLVIIPEHSWGNESYLHISNKLEECQSQQSRLVLAPTTLSCGCRRLVEHGRSHGWHRDAIGCVQHCWHLASWARGEQTVRCVVICLKRPWPTEKLPLTFPLCPAHRPQTEQKLTSDLTNWVDTKWGLSPHMTCIPLVHKPSLASDAKSSTIAFDLPFISTSRPGKVKVFVDSAGML